MGMECRCLKSLMHKELGFRVSPAWLPYGPSDTHAARPSPVQNTEEVLAKVDQTGLHETVGKCNATLLLAILAPRQREGDERRGEGIKPVPEDTR